MLRKLLLVVTISSLTHSYAEEPSANGIATNFNAAICKFSQYRVKSSDVTTGSPNSASSGFIERFESESIWDSQLRIREKWTMFVESTVGGKKQVISQAAERSISDKDYTGVTWMNPKLTRDIHVSAKIGTVGAIDTPAGIDRVRAGRGVVSRIFSNYSEFNQYEVPFTQLFLEKSTTALPDTLADKTVVRLENKSKWGTATVWLDPTRDYLPMRIVLAKGLNDWLERDKPISSFPALNRNFTPNDKRISNVITYDIDYGKGTAVGPTMSIRTDDVSRFKNGEETKDTTVSKVTELVLNPDFRGGKVFEIQTPIPDGTRVQVDEEPSIVYEWRKGQVVKVRVNENYVAPVVVPGTPWWRWPLVVIVVVGVLLGLWRGSAILRKG